MTADWPISEWIAADWGTTHLRLWWMAGGTVREERRTSDGMGSVAPGGFADALARATEGWPDLPVIACGMVGARQGWHEAPYRPVPCPATPRLTPVPGTRVHICGGVSQSDPPDVMRGEETQIAGLLAARPGFDGVVCLPGTHTKWARVSAGEICNFISFMTGEIFGLLAGHSVLRHTLAPEGLDEEAFDAAVADALSRPAAAYARLFQLRAGALVGDLDPVAARSRLSGTLIGWELAGAKPWWLGYEVVVIGAPGLASLYVRALTAQGVAALAADAQAVTLAGLTAARATLREPA